MVNHFKALATAACLLSFTACSGGEPAAQTQAQAQDIAIVIGVKKAPMQILSFNEDALTFTGAKPAAITDANYVRYAKPGKLLALRPGQISVAGINHESGEAELDPVIISVPALNAPTAVEISPDQRIIYTAHFRDNILSARGFGRNAAQEFDCGWAHQFRPHPNGKWAYAACMKDTLMQFNVERDKGQSPGARIVPMETARIEAPGGPRHMDFHPAGDTLYVLLQISSEVAVYDIDDATGALKQPPRQIIATTSDGIKNASSDIHITPSGKFVYAFNRENQEMTVFIVAPDRSLKRKEIIPMEHGRVRDWAMSGDGHYLITATDKGHVGAWRIDESTGGLTLTSELTGLGNAISVAIIK